MGEELSVYFKIRYIPILHFAPILKKLQLALF